MTEAVAACDRGCTRYPQACADESRAILREALHGDDAAEDAAQAPLSAGDRSRYAAEAVTVCDGGCHRK